MKAQGTDIDIDLDNRDKLLQLINHVPAMQKDSKGRKVKHNTGVYFHDAPVDPYTGLCTLDYKTAEDMGYFKIDILNVSVYQGVKDPDHLDRLAAAEPDWSMLMHEEIVQQLFHIHSYSDLVKRMRPTDIEQLAMVLALIRPGKKHLIGRPWAEIAGQVWEKGDEGYSFKRSHALGYALAIIVQMNLLREQALGIA
jgi:DNA polymerase III alpha subunit